jgi:uncharacterized protein (DUF302 family)
MSYGMTLRIGVSFDEAVNRVRAALLEQGFGVLTEIDVKATMKAKLGADVEDYVILGACNPPLAHRALELDRGVGLLLPCNVVVRAASDDETVVEVLDPNVIAQVSAAPGLDVIAKDAAARLEAALDTIRDAAPIA